jgi:hypothetical protein
VHKRIGPLAYRLQLLQRAHIHNVFHIAFFKKFEGMAPAAFPPLPPIVCGCMVPVPQEVVRTKPTATSCELLIKWADRALAEASWE